MTEAYPAEQPRDIIDRLMAARPYLPFGDRVDNLVTVWFRAALETYAGTRDISAFAPFMDEFSGRSLIEGFHHFLDTQRHILASQPHPNLTEAEFTGLLRHALRDYFDVLGIDAENVAGKSASVVDDILFDYVGMLLILDPIEAFDWATRAISPGMRLRELTTGAGTPVPLRLLRDYPDGRSGIGSEAAIAFQRAIFDWCIVNRRSPGVGPAVAKLFHDTFAGLENAELQVRFLQRIVEPSEDKSKLPLIGILEIEIDLQNEDQELSIEEADEKYEEMSKDLALKLAPNFYATLAGAMMAHKLLKNGIIGSKLLQPLALKANPDVLKKRSSQNCTDGPEEKVSSSGSMLMQIGDAV